jgi:hypothetical protein
VKQLSGDERWDYEITMAACRASELKHSTIKCVLNAKNLALAEQCLCGALSDLMVMLRNPEAMSGCLVEPLPKDAEGQMPQGETLDDVAQRLLQGHPVTVGRTRGDLASQLHSIEERIAKRKDAADVAVGAWLCAALDDPKVCPEMKRDINEWLEATALPVVEKAYEERSTKIHSEQRSSLPAVLIDRRQRVAALETPRRFDKVIFFDEESVTTPEQWATLMERLRAPWPATQAATRDDSQGSETLREMEKWTQEQRQEYCVVMGRLAASLQKEVDGEKDAWQETRTAQAVMNVLRQRFNVLRQRFNELAEKKLPPEYEGDCRDPAAGCWYVTDHMHNSPSSDVIHCRNPCVEGTRYCEEHQ